MDTSKINKMGWSPKINLLDGVSKTIKEFITSNHENF
jgi:dTDP-D-glucose 4,6-dehydratase